MPDESRTPNDLHDDNPAGRAGPETNAGYDEAARGGKRLPYDPVPFDSELGPDEMRDLAEKHQPQHRGEDEDKQRTLEAIDDRAARDAADEVRRRERSAD